VKVVVSLVITGENGTVVADPVVVYIIPNRIV
jgi:hypothetical protein